MFVRIIILFLLLLLLSQQRSVTQEVIQTERVWQFDLVSDSYRLKMPGKPIKTVPHQIFGQLLLSNDRQRFVYRYLRSNVDVNGLNPASESQYKYVVAYDGKKYWAARFDKYVDSTVFFGMFRFAGYVETQKAGTVYSFELDRLPAKKRNRIYDHLPIHQLFHQILSDNWEYKNIVNALQESEYTTRVFEDGKFLGGVNPFPFYFAPAGFIQPKAKTKYFAFVPAHEFQIGGNWEYLIEVQEDAPFISKCRVHDKIKFFGRPHSDMPHRYTITVNANQVAVDSKIFDSKYYSSKSTKFKKQN